MSGFLLALWAISAGLQMAFLAALWCCDLSRLGRDKTAPDAPEPRPAPLVSLIIPCAGRSGAMETALHSLLQQDYPSLAVLLVTHGRTDPARQLALELAAQYPHARHVEARAAEGCGQKNRNMLDALAEADPETAVYAFCDANHLAKRDFVRCLAEPIIQGREKFCTGYRRTRPLCFAPATVACHFLVWHLGLFQGLPWFTQPWGGAFAAEARAFRELGVAELWSRTVVDDVSLAGLLMRERRRVNYCPGAMLDSPLEEMSETRLNDWFFRQLFYPKFYTLSVWLLLGAALAWFAATALGGLGLAIAWIAGAGPSFPFALLALAHLASPIVLRGFLRRRIAPDCPPAGWRQGVALAARTLAACFCRTVFSRVLVWRGIRYHLASDGKVERVERPDQES